MPPVGFEPTNPNKRKPADLHLRLRGHWDGLYLQGAIHNSQYKVKHASCFGLNKPSSSL